MNPISNRNPMQLFLTCLLWWTWTSCYGQADLSQDLEAIRSQWHLPGLSAVAVKGGHVVAQGAVGWRRVGETKPLLLSDPVHIGSCTKWMTATVAGRLIDRGKLRWESLVSESFAESSSFQSVYRVATLDQILAHRAGIQQGSTFEGKHWQELISRVGSLREIRRWVADTVLQDSPEVPPGQYLYSNQGYAVAAAMLEQAQQKSWEDLVHKEIFRPLRMRSARIGLIYNDAVPPAAVVGHDLAAEASVAVPRKAMTASEAFHYQASNAPGGAVACTLWDWVRFLQVFCDHPDVKKFLKPQTKAHLMEPYQGAEGYGRGVQSVSRSWAGSGRALNHAGDIYGQNSVFWMAPAKDFIVVVFTNCRSAGPEVPKALDAVASRLVARYADAPPVGRLLSHLP